MRILIIAVLFIGWATSISAHPMPNTDIAIRLGEKTIFAEIRVPVPELSLALSNVEDPDAVKAYFRKHMRFVSTTSVDQPYEIDDLQVSAANDQFVGRYQELSLNIRVPVTSGFNPRSFWLEYDAVIHQVPTHFALVKVVQDFDAGVVGEGKEVTIGAIRSDITDSKVRPFFVSTAGGNLFRGLAAMITLGMEHIITGTDHILFLLALLIVAPLAIADGRWTLYQGFRYSVRRFLSISISFTIGHSVALVLGSYGFLSINERFVEVAIATSILVTAIHAIRPIFSQRETMVALAFGLVHGLAFSQALSSLRLEPLQKALSIFGFNVGIEIMQIAIMTAAFPMLLLSKRENYHPLRLIAASLALVISSFWIIERIAGV
jgi:HupE / UreJ protein